ncbi:hypothetical protein KAFR_0L01550 [Kazachstania africana CBS 2517]|uniref:PRELI/MSF1 domain-containing protein n=1 Tax=Kazachstania africana (strain ATCC 22294 / BCRC 22015 / CBS 2517 / CECT 1963 / NBRC 1671 / NRRL Y-8276) TaxID=1071382 RepID=H2B2B5_KAZAF|nr:hypothetical protein KAFR_0L01550 [Kazachstania africana CBS 2517]CCF60765.1 hypothetical protein KAFR_0L01550 [Kazachstania africana CBS 2517]
MVLYYMNKHVFNNDFASVSMAFFNKYPNPYNKNTISIDVILRRIESNGNLFSIRLIKKQGKLPSWVTLFIGANSNITESWMIEYSTVNPKEQTLTTLIKNLNHTKLLQVEEHTLYRYNGDMERTFVNSKVKFSSGFKLGNHDIRNKIESWSQNKFEESVHRSRLGMSLVMQKIEEAAQNEL